jgi:hypothetical protein
MFFIGELSEKHQKGNDFSCFFSNFFFVVLHVGTRTSIKKKLKKVYKGGGI